MLLEVLHSRVTYSVILNVKSHDWWVSLIETEQHNLCIFDFNDFVVGGSYGYLMLSTL